MTSALDDFLRTGFDEAAQVMGQVSFTLLDKTVLAVLNEFTAEQELIIGGKSGIYTATVTGARPQLAHVATPIERTLYGRDITLEGRTFRITRCHLDGQTFTLGLSNPARGK